MHPPAYFDGGQCGHLCLGLHIALPGKHLVLSEQVPGDMQYYTVSLNLRPSVGIKEESKIGLTPLGVSQGHRYRPWHTDFV